MYVVIIVAILGLGIVGYRAMNPTKPDSQDNGNGTPDAGGETPDTGTQPDSAPQVPLKTPSSSPVSRILLKLVRGVPTISTPRTNWSGLPSG